MLNFDNQSFAQFENINQESWSEMINQALEAQQDSIGYQNFSKREEYFKNCEGVSYLKAQLNPETRLINSSKFSMTSYLHEAEFYSQHDTFQTKQDTTLKLSAHQLHEAGLSVVDEITKVLQVVAAESFEKLDLTLAFDTRQFLNLAKTMCLRYFFDQANIPYTLTAVSSLRDFTPHNLWPNFLRNNITAHSALIAGVERVCLLNPASLLDLTSMNEKEQQQFAWLKELDQNIYSMAKEESHLLAGKELWLRGNHLVNSLAIQLFEKVQANLDSEITPKTARENFQKRLSFLDNNTITHVGVNRFASVPNDEWNDLFKDKKLRDFSTRDWPLNTMASLRGEDHV